MKTKTNYDIFKSIRKPIAPPTKIFDWKKDKDSEFLIDEGLTEYEESKNEK